MIIFMCKSVYNNMIAVTNKSLCAGNYFEQIRKIARLKPHAILLREKDVSKEEYKDLAITVKSICDEYEVPMIVHTYLDVAKEIGCNNIHMSIKDALSLQRNEICKIIPNIDIISISCHNEEDVRFANRFGATQIVLGTIFETDCKKGLKGAGLSFVKSMSEITDLPIFAIGGIKEDNIEKVICAGAKGGCMMSGFMKM